MIPLGDDNRAERFQLLCLLLVLVNVAVFLLELSLGPEGAVRLFQEAGMVPSRFTDDQAALSELEAIWPPFTLVTSTFLHGGWLHLLGNMWFLWVFGDNVENAFGRVFFLPFYFFCGAVAAVAQIFGDPASTVPMVGASGAIAGVLGAYMVLYPAAQVETLVFLVVLVRIVRLPAILFLGLWFVFQLTGLFSSSNVAWWAHAGGFLAGAVVALLVRLFGGRDDELRLGGPRFRRRWSWGSSSRNGMVIRLPPEYR